jgi:hypothetical protein
MINNVLTGAVIMVLGTAAVSILTSARSRE